MLSGGYLRWLALSPQGKYPVRAGDRNDRTRFVAGWSALESGVRPKAPLADFFSQDSVDAIAAGAERFERWGFTSGQGALEGALESELTVPEALSAVIRGDTSPVEAAARLQAEAERLQGRLRAR